MDKAKYFSGSTYDREVMVRDMASEMPKTATEAPVDRAISEMFKQIDMVREQAQALVSRLHPVIAAMPCDAARNDNPTVASCKIEGNIKGATEAMSEIAQLLNDARERLCI
jgi:hypothetical protein